MIPEAELEEIRNYLEKAENPLFLFDDDNDGLCSYILFRQFTKKGIGIPIKTHPSLDITLLNRVEEHRPDFIFILDKPIVTQEFIDSVKVPVIWLDHHPLLNLNNINYYNPKKNDPNDISSTTNWAYKTVKGKLWIAVLGAVSDWTVPDFFEEFKEKYLDLTNNKTTAPDLLFDSKLGELCRIFSFVMKGKTGDVNKKIKATLKIEEPYDILEQKTKEGIYLFEEAEKINKIYKELLERAIDTEIEDNILIFTYTSGTSLTADLSNELLYKNPGKIILIGRENEGHIRMSIRSDKIEVDKILEKALEDVEGYGGGHKLAVGASVKQEDFPKFIENLKKEISNQ